MGRKFDKNLASMSDEEVISYDEARLNPQSKLLLEREREKRSSKHVEEKQKRDNRSEWLKWSIRAGILALLALITKYLFG